MLFNLLSASGTNSTGTQGSPWQTWIMFGIIAVVLVAFMIYNRQVQKKRQKETTETLNAIQPGNKVKTIGGICGIVVEVCPDDNTFVLETGTEKSGKSYLKFDKQAVYQTDAVAKKEEKKEVVATEPVVEEKTETAEVTATETEETKDAE